MMRGEARRFDREVVLSLITGEGEIREGWSRKVYLAH